MDNNINNFNNNMNNDMNNNINNNMNNDMNNNMNNNINNNKQTNIYAILGLIFSFFFSIAGLILSIIGLKKSKELNNGKGLSIAGIVISSIQIVVVITISVISSFILSGLIKIGESVRCGNVNIEDCELNSDGTYSCLYGDLFTDYKTIICKEEDMKKQDKEEDIIENNDEKDDITGVWKPEKITDINGMEINPAKYFGFLEEGNENKRFELILNSDGTSYNDLSGYEDENDINGTYKIKNDKIYITNNNNTKIDKVDIKYNENNQVYLILTNEEIDVYLYKYNDINK